METNIEETGRQAPSSKSGEPKRASCLAVSGFGAVVTQMEIARSQPFEPGEAHKNDQEGDRQPPGMLSGPFARDSTDFPETFPNRSHPPLVSNLATA